MINQLHRIVEENYDNGSQLTRLPNNQEMMNKINEIINMVNRMQTEHSQLVWDNQENPFMPTR